MEGQNEKIIKLLGILVISLGVHSNVIVSNVISKLLSPHTRIFYDFVFGTL